MSWKRPHRGRIKCNTDGVSRGNPGDSAYNFCLRDDQGDIIYAEAERLGHKTNMEAETIAILKAHSYCKCNNYNNFVLETDSLIITNIVRREWKIPWQQVEEIQAIISSTNAQMQHVFREANK